MINQTKSIQRKEKREHSARNKDSSKLKISNTEISNISSISNFFMETENNKKQSSNNNSFVSLLGITDNSFQKRNKNIVSIKLGNHDGSPLEIDFALAEKGFPDILSRINYETKTLILNEKWIDYKTVRDYYIYVKLCYSNDNANEDLSNLRFNFKKLTQLANYFENERILAHMIQMNIEPNITCDTCVSLINDAFKYCSNENVNSNLKSKWFALFLKLRNFITNNFIYFLSEPGKNHFIKLNVKLLEEIIESFLLTIYTKRIEISSEQATQIVLFILFLRNKNHFDSFDIDKINYDDIFTFLNHEKEYLCSPNNIIEITNCSTPTFSLNLLKDVNYSYQEKAIQFQQQELIFISKYDSNSDTFTISVKLNPINTIDVFTFVSFGQIIEDGENSEINFCTINNSSKVTIYTINSYKGYVNYMKGIKELSNLNLVINLKFCIMHSFLLCYLKNVFDEIYNMPNIKLIPANMFNVLLANSGFKEDNILISLMHWLSDNQKEADAIVDILEQLDWKKIPLGRIFEFVIKFPFIIERNGSVENCIISAIFAKANDKLAEMRKERIYSEKMNDTFLEKKITQFSYEGDLAKCEAIVNNDNNNLNLESNNTNRDTNSLNLVNDETQINLLSYFFVNLLECSKKINYQNVLSSNEFLKKEIKFQRQNVKKVTYTSVKSNNSILNISHVSARPSNKSIKSNNIVKISLCENDDNKMPSINLNEDKKISLPSNKELVSSRQKSRSKSTKSVNKKIKEDEHITTEPNQKQNEPISQKVSTKNSRKEQPSIKLCSIVQGNSSTNTLKKRTNSEKHLTTHNNRYNLEINSNPVDINNNHSKHSNKTSNKSSIHPLQTNSSVNLDQSSLSKVIKQH